MIITLWGVKTLLNTRKSYLNFLVHFDLDQFGKIQKLGKFVGNVSKNFIIPLNLKFKRTYSTSETIRKENLKFISEHVPKKKSIFDLTDEEFGYYLAGFIDSHEKDISIHNQIWITFNLKNQSFAYSLKKRIGFGNIKIIKNSYYLIITNIEGIIKIINLINGKLKLENKVTQLKNLIQINNLTIQINNSDSSLLIINTYWFAGFTDGIGSFQILIKKRESKKEFSLNYQILFKKDFLLKEIKNIFNGGYIGFNKNLNLYYFESSRFNIAYKIIQYFNKFPLQSTKYLNFLFWRKTYIFIQNKKHLTLEGITKIKKMKTTLESN
ncbi:LAGLIDADG endonuclease (mitochondrion) [Paramicrosporidium saccamoebae]|uniref:LAGLIDADG endonuclease n=1 Tax=Paramicrosporidium saccamoebae TaxID=1246581 RepID=A0A2H9TR08_9FUNG|nr:LAGLIDADG endonuclease [Paramicrosporidium saccamoebae]